MDAEEYVERVLQCVESVPRGRVTTYGAIALARYVAVLKNAYERKASQVSNATAAVTRQGRDGGGGRLGSALASFWGGCDMSRVG